MLNAQKRGSQPVRLKEGIERVLFIIETMHPDIPNGVDNEENLLRVFAKLQILNNKYRKDMKKCYDLGSGSNGDLLNSTVFGLLTNGLSWNFLQYTHNHDQVTCTVIHHEKV
jgi:hypothetical protein